MKSLFYSIFSLLLCLHFAQSAFSQENFASNVSKSISDGEKLLITYDLVPQDNAKSFSVILLLTHQGRQVEASSAYGDIGSNIAPGKEKAIVWYFKDDFDGDINSVEVDVLAYRENEPQAIFKIASVGNKGYAPSEVTFLNNSSYANEYQWNFSDPASGTQNVSFEKDPVHVFEKGGIYSIALTARNTQLNLENTYYQSIEIKTHDPTVANFEIEGNNQLPPAKVDFKNTSVNADTYFWDFGDPSGGRKNTTDKEEPRYKYKSPGTYKVTLIVKNNFSGLSDTLVKEVIVEQEKKAEAGFVFTKSSETAPATVAFKNTSVNADEYEWDFGDPASGEKNSSKEANPAHVYDQPGSYEVELSAWAKGERKPSTFTEVVEIAELPQPPEASFTIENNNVLGPATILFKNNSQNAEDYSWDFGDPDSRNDNYSTKETPTHTYQKAGRYKVTLTASHSKFNNTSSASDYVVIVAPSQPPVATFSIEAEDFTHPAKVRFINASANADSFSWDFGDPNSSSNTSTEKSPSHTFSQAGKYKVVLTAINKKTGEESLFSDFVIVNEQEKPTAAPVARFAIENNNSPSPAIVKFTDQSTDAHSYSWNFGDENSDENTSVLKNPVHIYSEAGRYMVTLVTKNESSGQTDKFTDFVVVTSPARPAVRPVAKFTFSGGQQSAPAEMGFSNSSSGASAYEWNFGDPDSPDNISTEENPTHTFTKAGRYQVKLTAVDSGSGLSATYSEFVTVTPPVADPVADFVFNEENLMAPAAVQFTGKSENANSFAWNFGDPASGNKNASILESPQHVFEKPGKYTVELTVLNKESGREDAIKKTITIAKPPEPPVAGFEITFNGEYVPLDIEFKNSSENADTWKWNFGDFDSDNNESTAETPVHRYVVPGTYKITLTAINSETGEKDEVEKELTLKSNFPTFVNTAELGRKAINVPAVISTGEDEFICLAENENGKSSILKMNLAGKIIEESELDFLITDILYTKEELISAGIESDDKLVLQKMKPNLETANKIDFQQRKKFVTGNFPPLLALSITDEVGVVANTLDDKYPIDILFQKTEKSGRIISLVDRTFKYVGTKLVTDLVPTSEGGFALTGYWKEDEKSPMLILFGKIDRKGHGEMHLISSEMNIIGCDIEESYQDGFAILRAKEGIENSDIYEMSFILIDSDGGPTDCATMLPCSINKDDILKYRPRMIKVENGYVVASHGFNGMDYDVSLFWIDKSGDVLMRYEEIRLPGNQFVMDFTAAADGGFIISGTNGSNALLIKTDPYGKLNNPVLP
jgi:PKD repeat protein